jgi:uncharacterized protein (DUF2062 family)
MKNPLKRLKDIFKINDQPQIIAKGFALGSFIGMLPIPGLQIFVAFGISRLIKVNSKAACVAVFNTNIFTGAFIFAFNFWLGKEILGINTSFQIPDKISLTFIQNIMSAGYEVFISLLFGGIITGILIAILTYHIMYYLIKKSRDKSTPVNSDV